MRGSCGGYHLKPMKTTDTVIHMYNQITGRQALNLGQEIFGLTAFFRLTDQAIAQNILFGNHGQLRRFKSRLYSPDSQVNAPFADAGAVLDWDHLANPFILDQTRQTFTRALGIACDDNGRRF